MNLDNTFDSGANPLSRRAWQSQFYQMQDRDINGGIGFNGVKEGSTTIIVDSNVNFVAKQDIWYQDASTSLILSIDLLT